MRRESTAIAPWIAGVSKGRRLMALVAAACVAMLWIATPASAHSGLVSSDPAEGDVLEVAPTTVTLVFTESVELRRGDTRLTSGSGSEVSISEVSADGRTLTLTLGGDLGAGSHALQWSVASADGHPINGVLRFSTKAGLATTTTATPDVAETIGGAEATATPDVAEATGLAADGEGVVDPADAVSARDSAEEPAEDSTEDSAEFGVSLGVVMLAALAALAVVGALVVVLRGGSNRGEPDSGEPGQRAETGQTDDTTAGR